MNLWNAPPGTSGGAFKCSRDKRVFRVNARSTLTATTHVLRVRAGRALLGCDA